jgi:CRISPR-associated protein Cas1
MSAAPELVPARMLNEFTYCPRLFHLEWVQSEFTDSADTVEGRSVHARVDAPKGRLRDPGHGSEGVEARSVMLDAPRLGMVARIDIVEGDGDGVIPVERKRGRPRRDGGVWEPEEVQVVAQAMILRENGYAVTRGVVSYPDARTRVEVPLTPEREHRVRQLLAELRRTADGPCPPPLVDSPKCPRCSLVGICLPDETNALVTTTTAPPRRLITPRDDAAPLYVQEQGNRVGVRAGRLEVRDGETLVASVRPVDVSHLSLFGNVGISAQALRLLAERDVPVIHHTYGGWLTAVTTGPGHRNAGLRIAQFAVAAEPDRALAVARRIIAGKIQNQRVLLRRNARVDVAEEVARLRLAGRRAESADTLATLLGIEGSAARSYFSRFPAMLAADADRGTSRFTMAGRNRRPPRDPVNTLLSFAYSLLLRETVVAAISIGLDPYVGVLHQPRYGRPALALDLAEEFRPLIADSVVIGAINNGEVTPSMFIVRGGGHALTPAGRRALIAAFERRMATEIRHPLFGYRASYRRVLSLQARLLARVLVGEIAEYTPFVTR